VPPRAPLPEGVPNYVTPRGLALLRTELAELERERATITASDDVERERRLEVLRGRIAELGARLATAQLVDPRMQPHDDVRFGATVSLRDEHGTAARYTIVGVDEAAPSEGRIAFLAPLARALLGRAVGDTTTLRTTTGEQHLEIEDITYEDP
jgi:transcription elongation factor GreB